MHILNYVITIELITFTLKYFVAMLHKYFSFFQVIEHYENPRNVGSMNKGDQDVGTGLVGAPACGDVMKLQVRKP